MKGLDPHSGTELWAVEGAGVTTLIVADGVIYMGCYDKSVRAVEADTGVESWSCVKHTGERHVLLFLRRRCNKPT
jgi:outer membrane protein assembly factor BamB